MMLNVETRSAGVLCVCSTVYSSTCAHVYTCVVHECMNVTVFVCTHMNVHVYYIHVPHVCMSCVHVCTQGIHRYYIHVVHMYI